MLAQMIKHGGFQAAEAEIERITARFRGAEFHGSGRSVCCGSQPIENRAPGVTEREEFRDFVISLARRIVARLPQLAVTKKRDDAAGEAYDKVDRKSTRLNSSHVEI